MSAKLFYVIVCGSCSAEFGARLSRAHATRDEARKAGWTQRLERRPSGGVAQEDYCPRCSTVDLIERSSVGEGLQRISADGVEAEAQRAADELTPEVVAQVVEANERAHAGVTPDDSVAPRHGRDDWHALWDGDPRMPRDR